MKVYEWGEDGMDGDSLTHDPNREKWVKADDVLAVLGVLKNSLGHIETNDGHHFIISNIMVSAILHDMIELRKACGRAHDCSR